MSMDSCQSVRSVQTSTTTPWPFASAELSPRPSHGSPASVPAPPVWIATMPTVSVVCAISESVHVSSSTKTVVEVVVVPSVPWRMCDGSPPSNVCMAPKMAGGASHVAAKSTLYGLWVTASGVLMAS